MKIKEQLCFLSLAFLGFVFLGASTVPETPPPKLSQSAESSENPEKLIEAGKYLEAQKIYEQMLQTNPQPSGEAEAIRQKYEALNLKILLLPTQTSDSTTHVVSAGENLYKIAKTYDNTIDFLKKANGFKGDTIHPGMKLKVISGKFSIKISKSENILWLYLNDKLVKHYRVATSTPDKTPAGEFQIVSRLANPTWYKPGGPIIPPGSPKNSLGTRWLGLDKPGYGIHGTTEPESIGTHVTHGCVRMLNSEVEEIYTLVPVGTKVTVSD